MMKSGQIRINEERLCKMFEELVSIDAPSFQEREMADALLGRMRAMGMEVREDQAGSFYGGNAGNVYGFLKGTLPGDPILLCAHMDTVEPALGKQAVRRWAADGTGEDIDQEDPVVSRLKEYASGGDTVLGADDVSGIVEILEAIRSVQEAGIPHRDIEVLFPAAEEVFIKGTDHAEYDWLKAKEAYVLDMSGAIGTAALQAPSLISFTAEIHGKAAHAGFEPEKGVHAIALMARAIAGLKMGRQNERTTLNIGTIEGGKARNIVPDFCSCRGEIRSFDHQEALECLERVKAHFQRIAEGTLQENPEEDKTEKKTVCAKLSFEAQVDLVAYDTPEDDVAVKHFREACEGLSIPVKLIRTFGGSDNNNFMLHGIHGLVLSCGYELPHSVNETASVTEMVKGAMLIAALLT